MVCALEVMHGLHLFACRRSEQVISREEGHPAVVLVTDSGTDLRMCGYAVALVCTLFLSASALVTRPSLPSPRARVCTFRCVRVRVDVGIRDVSPTSSTRRSSCSSWLVAHPFLPSPTSWSSFHIQSLFSFHLPPFVPLPPSTTVFGLRSFYDVAFFSSGLCFVFISVHEFGLTPDHVYLHFREPTST